MLKILLLLCLLPSISFGLTSPKCPGQNGYIYTNDKSKRNPRKGGFVAEGANVGDYVFIAPTAAICDSASVIKFSKVYGNAVIKGEAEITDKARVYGDAVVDGEAVVGGEAKVSGHARITGSAVLKGTTWAKGHVVLAKGTFSKGKFTAAPTSAYKQKQVQIKKQAAIATNAKQVAMARNELMWLQKKMKQGWYGKDKRKGIYRSFKWTKADIKAPCGFYLKLRKQESILKSHCRRTKRVKRKRWSPKGGDYKTVSNCPTEYENQGEKFFDFKKLVTKTHHDYSNKRDYLEVNSFYFHLGNSRKAQEFGDKLKTFARKYCGYKG